MIFAGSKLKNMRHLLLILLIVTSFPAWAQTGKISGKVVDQETGEELIGAAVQVDGTTRGAVADLYGDYLLELEPGTYTLVVQYVSYTKQIIEGVVVNEGETTTINVTLGSEAVLEEIVVTAEAIKDNDVVLLQIQKKAFAVQDGISSSEIRKLGVSNAAESMRQVTGASIEGGKYMVMRGLGDRYSITQMNNVTIPSADPYRNSTSMDLIPSDMIENITTLKTFTPDQPGNFTGGKVNITSKSIPDEFYFRAKVSATYNTQSSFADDFLLDPAANNEMTGFDGGIREKPEVFNQYEEFLQGGAAESTARRARIPENNQDRQIIHESARSLSNGFLPNVGDASLDHGLELAIGNRYSLGDKPLGFNLGLNYSRSFLHLDNKTTGIYSDGGSTSLINEQSLAAVESTDEAQIGALLGLSLQLSPHHELSLNSLYNHSGASKALISNGFWRNTASPFYETQAVHFQERGLFSTQLLGKHVFEGARGLKVDWVAGYMNLTQDEPDLRQFGYVVGDNGDYVMNKSEVGRLPSHFYRDLEDEQLNFQLDITLPITQNPENVIKAGFAYSDKQRTFNESQLGLFREPIPLQPGLNDNVVSFTEAAGNLPAYFSLSNYGVVGGPGINESNGRTEFGIGQYYSDQTVLGNSYTGDEIITAGYLMGVYKLTEKLKAVAGVRIEKTELTTISADTTKRFFGKVDEQGNPVLESRNGSIDETDILPSVNFIYELSEHSNLRAAFSQTLARPNMREISPFASFGTPNEPTVLGNKDLKRTLIQNYDLRYEVYPRPGELFALSAYYKNFQDPIIWLLTPKASTPEIQPANVDQAIVMGVEAEIRKTLDFISPSLENFQFGMNVSYIFSEVDKDQRELDALESANRPNIEDTRTFQGQSPYILNFRLSHNSQELQWENNVSFNIFGERLAFVTGALDPDVFEKPRPSLNFVSNKALTEHWSLGFKAINLLDMTFKKEFDDDRGVFNYENYRIGRSFTFSLSYAL